MNNKGMQIILNPVAGAGTGLRIVPELKSLLLEKACSDFRIHITRKPGEATDIARELIGSGTKLIVAAGGDGTVNEVLNGFSDGNGQICQHCTLGIIRCGTGMGTALSLGIPGNLRSQVDLLLGEQEFTIDIGKINFTGFDGRPKQRLFISESQLGIGSVIADKVHNGYKFLGGKFAFGVVSLIQAMVYREQLLTVEADEVNILDIPLIGIGLGNGSLTAGGMKLTPGAKTDDGLLDVLFIHKMGMTRRLVNFLKIYSGSHIHSEHFSYFKAREIRIDGHEGTTISADGELLGRIPCLIRVLPSILKVKSFLINPISNE